MVSRWQPIPFSWVREWRAERRSVLWQALVHRVHGADAVDGHGLSIPDAERIVSVVLDEIARHDGVEPYPMDYAAEFPRLPMKGAPDGD